MFPALKLLVSNKVETNYEIALLILLNGGIWRLQFDLIHDEEQVKGGYSPTNCLFIGHTEEKWRSWKNWTYYRERALNDSKLYKSEFFFFVGIVKDYYSANFCNFGMFFRNRTFQHSLSQIDYSRTAFVPDGEKSCRTYFRENQRSGISQSFNRVGCGNQNACIDATFGGILMTYLPDIIS